MINTSLQTPSSKLCRILLLFQTRRILNAERFMTWCIFKNEQSVPDKDRFYYETGGLTHLRIPSSFFDASLGETGGTDAIQGLR